jgi:hypothetical protein
MAPLDIPIPTTCPTLPLTRERRATAGINPCMTNIRPIPPDQEAFERDAVWTMYSALQSVRNAGYNDWQTLTSFFANLLIDQDNPHKMLKQLFDDTKVKLNFIRDQQRRENL